MKHKGVGKSDEWYTPKYIFDALGEEFDLDVAHPFGIKTNVPAKVFYHEGALSKIWSGFIWCNPPFGGRNHLIHWVNKIASHGNGLLLTTDATSSPFFKMAIGKMDAVLFTYKRVKFERPDGTKGNQPANGTAIFAFGERAVISLENAEKNNLGFVLYKKEKRND